MSTIFFFKVNNMKYWHPHFPFGQHISVYTLVISIKKNWRSSLKIWRKQAKYLPVWNIMKFRWKSSVMLRHMIPARLWYDGWRATWSRWSASADFKLSISLRIQCFRSGGSNQQLSVRRMSVYIDRFYSARSLCIYCCFLPRKSLYC